jgi:hypothetical protein
MNPSFQPHKTGNTDESEYDSSSRLIQPQMKRGIQPQIKRGISQGYLPQKKNDKLPENLQTKMENSFGEDFSDVTIHTDSDKATELGAKAYAQGKDLHFAPGEFQPNSKEGQELIGHELTHVVQQKEGTVQGGEVHGKDMVNHDVSLEKEADDAGKLASEGKSVEVKGSGNGVQMKEKLSINSGQMSAEAENANLSESKIHWPETAESGVTIGFGYDIGARSQAQVKMHLTQAGMDASTVQKIIPGAGLQGSFAENFVEENADDIGNISAAILQNLFTIARKEKYEDMKNTATSTTASKYVSNGETNYVNAKAREEKDEVEAGTYVMSATEFAGLHPAIVEFMLDLTYQGGFYKYQRVASINKILKANLNNPQLQLKGLRTYFQSEEIENYNAIYGGSKYKAVGTEKILGDNITIPVGERRRQAIRLAFLDKVIKGMEEGKDVEIAGISIITGNTPLQNNTSSIPSKKDIISDSVGVSGKNIKSDVVIIQTLLYKAGYNLSISGAPDAETFKAIIAFQKSIFTNAASADGLITPFKTTITKLKEYQNKSRIPVTKQSEAKAEIDHVKIVQQAFENYKSGTINMVSLGSKLKEHNRFCPTTTINVFIGLGSTSRDNLAYTMANQSSDEELAQFNLAVLKRMSGELGGWLNSTSWGENTKQKVRVDKVIESKENVPKQAVAPTNQTANSSGSNYLSQMDNTYQKTSMYGDDATTKIVMNSNECNVTALAMALAIKKPIADLKTRIITLLRNDGLTESTVELQKQQLEDLILKRFEQLGAEYFLPGIRKYFGDPTFEFTSPAPHQYAYCLQIVGQQILNGDSLSASKQIMSDIYTKEGYVGKVKTRLAAGESCIIGTDLTGSGHVVTLIDVKEDGITINDPYGLLVSKQGEYLINGSILTQATWSIIQNSPTVIGNKLKHAPNVKSIIDGLSKSKIGMFTFPHKMGENNFYTWTQVRTYNIGKWLNFYK